MNTLGILQVKLDAIGIASIGHGAVGLIAETSEAVNAHIKAEADQFLLIA